MTDKNRKLGIILNIFLLIGIVGYLIVFCMINIFHTKAGLFADATQTAIGARVFWENRSISPENWFAWSESGVFSLATIGAFVYGMTESLLLTQSIAPVIASIFLILSAIYLLKSIKLSITEQLIGMLLIFALPWGIYPQSMSFLYYAAYSLCIMTAFFQIGVYVKLVNNNLKFKKATLFFSILLSFAQGSNSSRAVLTVYAPLFLLATYRIIIILLEKRKDKQLDVKKEFTNWFYTILIACTGYTATWMPWANRTQMSKALRNSPVKLLKSVLPAMLDWVGIDQSTTGFIKGMILILLITTIGVLTWSIIKMDVKSPLVIVFQFLFISVLLTTFMLSITQTEVTQRYFFMLPYVFVFSFLIVFRFVEELPKPYYLGIILPMFIYAYLNMNINFLPMLDDKNIEENKEQIVDWMIQNDYHYGYSGYMDANSITIYSDGEIQISAVDLNNFNIHKWVTDPKWYYPHLPYEMKTVYIFDKADSERYTKLLQNYKEMKKQFETEKYILFVSDYNYTNQSE